MYIILKLNSQIKKKSLRKYLLAWCYMDLCIRGLEFC